MKNLSRRLSSGLIRPVVTAYRHKAVSLAASRMGAKHMRSCEAGSLRLANNHENEDATMMQPCVLPFERQRAPGSLQSFSSSGRSRCRSSRPVPAEMFDTPPPSQQHSVVATPPNMPAALLSTQTQFLSSLNSPFSSFNPRLTTTLEVQSQQLS
jgi:hypothetical protein